MIVFLSSLINFTPRAKQNKQYHHNNKQKQFDNVFFENKKENYQKKTEMCKDGIHCLCIFNMQNIKLKQTIVANIF